MVRFQIILIDFFQLNQMLVRILKSNSKALWPGNGSILVWKWHNSGIVAFTGKPTILQEWAQAIHNTNIRGDQEVLHTILDPLRTAVMITDLPNKFNYMRVQMIDGTKVPDVLVKHWTGYKGKEHIRSIMKND